MQAGFLCFEVGSVREKTVKSVAVKNGVDWIVCVLAFSLVGFGLMFGQSAGGWIGTGIVWSCATAYACFKLIERAFGLRVSPEEEAAGIDLSGDVVIESAPADPIDEDLLRGLMLGDAGE